MKLIHSFKHILMAIGFSAVSLVSCDYLDVVPAEQPNIDDAMSNHDRALGFLHSCYKGCETDHPWAYLGEIASTTDEYLLPNQWAKDGMWGSLISDNVTSTNLDWVWGTTYRYVGQCYLFLQKLEEIGIPNKVATDAEIEEWRAECQFLVAWYHFMTLRRYGPCPITDSYIAMDSPTSSYNGRSHFDYCVDWIANQLDEAAQKLPATRSSSEWGRATSVAAKAIKARMLLYAASPLWNGGFPYPDWKNENFETPGYGKELVSKNYDPQKWERALTACKEALELAIGEGKRRLYDDEEYYSRQGLDLPFVPENTDEEFLKNVMKMRYAVTTRESEGNKEIIWGTAQQGDIDSRLPLRMIQHPDETWSSGWSGVAPTLYTIEHFYTKNGKLPAKDPDFYTEAEWFQSANIADREDIIKLNTQREPRFYAWMAFDGGDYGSKLSGGVPLKLQMRNSERQGFNPDLFNRDHSTTGYLAQKYVDPMTEYYAAGGGTKGTSAPTILFRLAELYLNLAECYASKANPDETNALKYLNEVRRRAGVPDLTSEMIRESGMSLLEWVQNERFVELWNEGHRFFDVRRWMKGAECFGYGKREGLNAEVVAPTFEEFNQRIPLTKYDYKWTNRMYLYPLFYNEVYKNPQMVQAPGY